MLWEGESNLTTVCALGDDEDDFVGILFPARSQGVLVRPKRCFLARLFFMCKPSIKRLSSRILAYDE